MRWSQHVARVGEKDKCVHSFSGEIC